MHDPIAAYIADEEAKIKALRDKADAREADLAPVKAVYEKVRGGQRPDVIDLNALVRSPETAPVARPAYPRVTRSPLPSQNTLIEWPTPPQPANPFEQPQPKRQVHKKGEARAAVLRPLADQAPKRLAEVEAGVAAQGYKLSYNHVRTELWTMKNEGLTTSPDKGVYQITKKGLAFLESQKGESPGATGLSSATVSGSDEA